MNPTLEIRALRKRFGSRVALDGIALELAQDTITAVLGTNGAGKTTLLRCILGLLAPDGGSIRVLGRDPLREARAVRNAIGYLPDQPDAYAWMCAQDLFRFLRVQYSSWSDERAERLLARLSAPAATSFSAMSRGESAKVMLAAALAPAAPLLLLDEPFARLSPPAREDVLSAFLEEAPQPGGAVLLATHDLDLAARVADRVVILERGRLVADEEVHALHAGVGPARGLCQRLRSLFPEPCPEGSAR